MFDQTIQHWLHAILFTAITILPTVPVKADIAANYAKLDSPTESRNIKTGSIEWHCEGFVCSATGAVAKLYQRHCEDLASQTGMITWFDIDGKPLSMTELTRCNLAADTKRGQTISMQLLDADTTHPISATTIDIYSDNGVRCVRAPCPTEGRSWQGQTDPNGWLQIPSEVFNRVTHLDAKGYGGRELMENAIPIEPGIWKVSLDPERRLDNQERPLRLFDARNHHPLARIDVWITESRTCHPPDCEHYSFHDTTNNLGYVYYSLSGITKNSWIHASGYKPELYKPGAVNYKMVLKPAESRD